MEFICEQGHSWSSPAAARQACPTCGSPGEAIHSDAGTQTFRTFEQTVPPGELPPLVSQLQTVFSDSRPTKVLGSLPERVSDYQIVREVGRGGMGVVYEARQLGLDRLVALKVIGGSYLDERDVLRFRQEAEAIARLQHPNVVQVFEIGECEQRPYLVLEYVDGPSLARLPNLPLPPASAAKLMQTLARAMEHVHRRGIVHRDLKPANILLALDGQQASVVFEKPLHEWLERAVPKISDFGLAKRIDADSSQTRDGTVMGTPSYMSPEQAEGRVLELGPAADVYSLGCVLYELLTGRPPFMADTARATLEQVIHAEPVPPTRLAPRVPRDLETICLKCLEKSVAKRYQSAGELADDLERYLDKRPILARRTGPVARLWKWSRRRPATAALILLSVCALVGSLAASQWHNAVVLHERNLAEENLRVSLVAIDEMLTEVGEEQLAYEPRMELKRRALLQKALALYRQFLDQRSGDTRLQGEVAHGYRRVGDIERWLGNHSGAVQAYEAAIPLFASLRQQEAGDLVYGRWQGYCLNYLGEAERQSSQPQRAEPSYQAAIEIQEQLIKDHPNSPDFQLELARTHYNLGILYRETNRIADAEKVLRDAMRQMEKLAGGDHNRIDCQQELARVHTNLGPILRSTNRTNAAIEEYSEAIRILTKLTGDHPDRADLLLELSVARTNRGNALRADKRTAEAKKDYEVAQQTLAQLATDYPAVALFLQELSNSENSLAAALVETDGPAAAEAVWLSASERLRKLAAEPEALPVYRADLGMTLGNLGWVSLRGGDAQKSKLYLEEGIARLREALAANPKHPDYLLSLRSQYRNLAEVSLRLGDHASADRAAGELTKVDGATLGDTFAAACFHIRCAALVKEDAELSSKYFRLAAQGLTHLKQQDFRDARLLEQAQTALGEALLANAEVHALFRALAASDP
jgi:tetratricopeptide (TPR) repeat protein/tRNA A-37 threonylcarbamoyl transferase component Bud32